MARKHHFLLAAIAGCLLLGGAANSLYAGTKAKQQEPQRDTSAQLAQIAAAVEKLPSAPSPDAGCEPGEDERQSDLCAQWKAADAAKDSALWGWWQLVIGGVGIILGGVTMGAAIAAAVFAKRAAVATESTVQIAENGAAEAAQALAIATRNATATEASVEISRAAMQNAQDIGVRQSRAYVVLDNVIFPHKPGEGGKITATAIFSNKGETPAFGVYSQHRVALLMGGADITIDLEVVPRADDGSVSVLAKGSDQVVTAFALDVPSNAYELIRLSVAIIIVYGWITYTDVYGTERRTDYRWHCNADAIARGHTIVMSSIGNEMT